MEKKSVEKNGSVIRLSYLGLGGDLGHTQKISHAAKRTLVGCVFSVEGRVGTAQNASAWSSAHVAC
jgi:hypothetical protein